MHEDGTHVCTNRPSMWLRRLTVRRSLLHRTVKMKAKMSPFFIAAARMKFPQFIVMVVLPSVPLIKRTRLQTEVLFSRAFSRTPWPAARSLPILHSNLAQYALKSSNSSVPSCGERN